MDKEESSVLLMDWLERLRSGAVLFKIFIFALLFFAFYLCYLITTPFLHVIILSIVFSGVAYPLYAKVLLHVKRPYIASLLVVFFIVLCIILPLVILFMLLIPEILVVVTRVQEYIHTSSEIISPEFYSAIQDFLEKYAPFIHLDEAEIQADIANTSKRLGQLIFTKATAIVTGTVHLVFYFFLFVLIMFFLLRDGERMFMRVRDLLPLHTSSFERITTSLRRVSKAVFVGGILVAIAQGIAASIGFFIIGYPSLLGGIATGIASLIPVIGTGLIWLPFSIYLLLLGNTQEAILFFLWSVIVVTNIDSFLRPYFMSGNVSASVLFIFLSILGGINIFGMLGIFYGPLILAFVMVMLDIYNEEFQVELKKKDSL